MFIPERLILMQPQVLSKNFTDFEAHVVTLSDRTERLLIKENASAELSFALAQMISDTGSSLRGSFGTWKTALIQNEEHLLNKLQEFCTEQTNEVSGRVKKSSGVPQLTHSIRRLQKQCRQSFRS